MIRLLLIFLTLFSISAFSQEKSKIEVDIKTIPEGEFKWVEWRGYPVYIFNLSSKQIKSVSQNSFKIEQTDFDKVYNKLSTIYSAELTNMLYDSTVNRRRTMQSTNVVVLFGVSPESLCMFIVKSERAQLEDPCSFSKFSYDGRPLSNNRKKRLVLLSPPYKLENNQVVLLNNASYEKR